MGFYVRVDILKHPEEDHERNKFMCNPHPKVSYCLDCGKELKRKDAKRCTFCSDNHTENMRRGHPKITIIEEPYSHKDGLWRYV